MRSKSLKRKIIKILNNYDNDNKIEDITSKIFNQEKINKLLCYHETKML